VLGYLDDMLILPVLVWLAVRAIFKELVAEHRSRCRNEEECPTG